MQVLLGCSRVGALVTVGRGTDPAAGGLAALGPEDLAPLREAIRAVLDDRDQRAAAQRVAAEIAVTPTLAECLAQLLGSRAMT